MSKKTSRNIFTQDRPSLPAGGQLVPAELIATLPGELSALIDAGYIRAESDDSGQTRYVLTQAGARVIGGRP